VAEDALEYDPFSPRWRDDPYPAYRRLRDEAPVHFAPRAKVWCVSRHEDALYVLRSPELFSSRAMFTMLMNQGRDEPPPMTPRMLWFALRYALRTRMNPFEYGRARSLIASDAEAHSGMRALVNRGFTPRRIAGWEPRIRAVVAECMQELTRAGRFDLMRDLAIPLPVTIIAEMLGIAPERRRDFKRWSDTVIQAASGALRDDPFQPAVVSSIIELDATLARLARERRARPADDLVSAIVASQEGEVALSIMEVVQFVLLLLVAGNETTTNLIGNAALALLDHPDQLARARRDPALVPACVEEVLRYDAPIQIVFRTATRDVEIAGTRIPAGAIVAPLIGSANRDERRFDDPDRFDIARNPQGHLGFGFGAHFCLGASLARLEARAALEALVGELPHLQRASAHERVDSFLVRGPRRLDLARAA
jgi:cytochrome P450